MSDETPPAIDLLAKYIAQDDDAQSPWLELVFRTGDRTLLGLRDLLSAELIGADFLLTFARVRVRVAGFQLRQLYDSVKRLERRRLAESRDPATVFEETPGAITKIEVEPL